MDRRDPKQVGWGNIAHFALQADEPPDSFYLAALGIQERLQELIRILGGKQPEASRIATDALFFALSIAELLDENGTSEMFARVGRRKRGKPPEASKMERARRGHRAAAIVMRLVAEGCKQEAAVVEAITRVSEGSNRPLISRSEVLKWLAHDRMILSMTPQQIADKFLRGK